MSRFLATRIFMNFFLRWIGVMAMILIVLTAGFVAIFWIWRLPIWSSLDAGWAQAITAAIGIGIATYIPYKQRVDAIRAEQQRRLDDARRIRLAIKDELKALQNKFSMPNVTYLLSLGENDIFDRLLSTKNNRFPIYASVIDRLTLIDDDDLRSEIIAAYEWADAMPTAVELNNALLLELREIEAELHYRDDEFQRHRLEFQLKRLRETRSGVQNICRQAIELVNSLVPKL